MTVTAGAVCFTTRGYTLESFLLVTPDNHCPVGVVAVWVSVGERGGGGGGDHYYLTTRGEEEGGVRRGRGKRGLSSAGVVRLWSV